MNELLKKRGSVRAVFEAAKRLGIKAEIISDKRALYKLSYRGRKEIFKELYIPTNSCVSAWIADNKDMTRLVLEKENISIVPGKSFNDFDQAVAYGKKVGFPLVVKANRGTHGDYVIVDIRDEAGLLEAVKKILIQHQWVIIEKMVSGKDYRILVLDKEILGALNRIPANVVGDGQKDIKKLIKEKNADPRRGMGHSKSLCKIKIDKELSKVLQSQGSNLDSIPKKGKRIFLRKNANISTGGDSIDVTDKVHPLVSKIAIEAVKATGLKFGAVDYISTDITKLPKESGGVILEINSDPMISIHEKPYQGKGRKVAEKILKYIFKIK